MEYLIGLVINFSFKKNWLYDAGLPITSACTGGSPLVGSPLEPVCCKKRQKSPNQETGLGNRGTLEALNDTKVILND